MTDEHNTYEKWYCVFFYHKGVCFFLNEMHGIQNEKHMVLPGKTIIMSI